MSTLQITYKKSAIGYTQRQKATIKALGLRKLNQTVEHQDSPDHSWHDQQSQPPCGC